LSSAVREARIAFGNDLTDYPDYKNVLEENYVEYKHTFFVKM